MSFPAPCWKSLLVPSCQRSPPQALQRKPPNSWQMERLEKNSTAEALAAPQMPRELHLPSSIVVFTVLLPTLGPIGSCLEIRAFILFIF